MAKIIVQDLLQIFRSCVSAVLPEHLIRKTLQYNPINQQMTVMSKNYNLQNRNVYVVGTGKAVQNMANEMENIFVSKIKQGVISIPVGSLNHKSTNKNILYIEGAESNLPDTDAESTARKVRDLVNKLTNDDVLLVLLSGGGSALLPLPKEPISLEEKTLLIKKLGLSGADIKELNTVRKRISDLKGGQLAIKANKAQIISLILSDIVGDPLDLIASGPTTENKDDPSEAINIINKYKLYKELPESIKTVLQDTNRIKVFPKDNVSNYIIGSNKISIAAAVNEAKKLNYLPVKLSSIITGNVKEIATEYIKLTKAFCNFKDKSDIGILKSKISSLNLPGIDDNFISQIKDTSVKNKDLCLILGGEITVEVVGRGKGGRNQQLALEFSNIIHESREDFKNFNIYFLSAGTDGIDGPTDAAGAIGYLDLISDAKNENLDVIEYLKNNDSYNFYKEFRNGNLHVRTGHTNTNVMDIHIILIKKL